MVFYADADNTNRIREVVDRQGRKWYLKVRVMIGGRIDGGSGWRGSGLYSAKYIVFVREPTTFQYRLSLEIMNG